MTLSILIPTYNGVCSQLVGDLQAQAEQCLDSYEIIVADDGSTDRRSIDANRGIDRLKNCRYIINQRNIGRAAIRNFLADQAEGRWLLFIDSDLKVLRKDFLRTYAHFASQHNAELCSVYGGYETVDDDAAHGGSLRYRYEKSRRGLLDVRHRQANADKDFKTSNVMIAKAVFEHVRFDDKLRTYGYEDTLFGRQLTHRGIPVYQIDNPVLFDDFESNESFLRKSEEAIANVVRYEEQLLDFSRLLQRVGQLQRWHLRAPLSVVWSLSHRMMRRNLVGKRPSVLIFNMYKLLLANELRAGGIGSRTS